MTQPNFRDFAGAIMGNDVPRAAEVLSVLLGLDPEAAASAATHFQRAMVADPTFMSKAMGLRTAVTGGSDEEIGVLLGECFGVSSDAMPVAIATLRTIYPRPA